MKPNDKEKKIVIIREGTLIGQDFRFFKWPGCCPPEEEYKGEKYQYRAKNSKMLFEAEEFNNGWICKRNGYGIKENYGNGAIHVSSKEGVVIIRKNDPLRRKVSEW